MSERPRRQSSAKGRRYYSPPRKCQFCSDKTLVIDYKKKDLLRSYTGSEGKIRPRRQTGNCSKHQRRIAIAIKRARHMALLPFAGDSLR